MASAAQAQQAPITPITEPTLPVATAPAAPVPERVAAPAQTLGQPGFDLQFSDIDVKLLLKTLGEQFHISIIISGDVEGTIGYINLFNQTPEEALQTVMLAQPNLSITRRNGTYIVSKAQPGAQRSGLAAPNDFAPNTLQQMPIAPSSNFGGPNGFDNSIFNNGFSNNSGVIGNGALGNVLPQFGQQNPMLTDLPTLVEASSGRSEQTQRIIRIKNVPANLIAYQLDPAHNPIPNQLQSASNNSQNYGEQPLAKVATDSKAFGSTNGFNGFTGSDFSDSPYVNPYLRNSVSGLIRPEVRANSQFGGGRNNQGGGGRNNQGGGGRGGAGGGNQGGGSFDLPGDIQQIVSVDPQNVLLVAGGSDEDIRRLQELIDVLDQPLRQVEIEAQFVELRSQDARSFGIDFSTARGNFDAATTGLASDPVPGAFQIGFVRNNFTARLNALIADNRAKVITAPRVTAINNLTASLFSTESRALILTQVSQNINGNQQAGQNLLFINSTTGLTVTPTINGDDTVTVLMRPTVTTSDGAGALATRTSRTLETIANVRDGDTIALGGLKAVSNSRQNYKVPLLGDIPFIGGLFRSKTITENESELIIFLTARIIRRAGDDIIVPGT